MKALSILFIFLIQMMSPNKHDVSWKDIKFKHKKGHLIVDGENRFKLKYSAGYFYISDLTSGDEIMYIYFNNNETISYIEDDYLKVYFSSTKTFLETNQHHKIIMEKLLNEGVIDDQWQIDDSKVAGFIEKYDENITNRTVR